MNNKEYHGEKVKIKQNKKKNLRLSGIEPETER